MAARKQNLISAEQGFLEPWQWAEYLRGYPTALLLDIRCFLRRHVDGLAEKFNTKSRYFGYAGADGSDVLYLYVQKQGLQIDLNIDRAHEDELRQSGFTVNHVNNYQGRAGWLTGWQVPHDTQNIEIVTRWIIKAFE